MASKSLHSPTQKCVKNGNNSLRYLKATSVKKKKKEMHTMRAGVYAKFPPIAVKLKGETAATKPSRPLYLMELRVVQGSGLMG